MQPDLPQRTTNTSLTEHRLRGEIRRVLYENDDGSYAVFKVRDSQGVEHTAVGPVFGAYEGQGIEMTGIWEQHREHGRQFRVKGFQFVLPTTEEGIKRYLASGVIPGIGKTYAERIVDHFGLRTLEILDRYSSRLKEVPGIGKKRIAEIRNAWTEQSERRNIFIFLQGLGISMAYCQRIYKVYGDQAAEMVKENPYRLARDIDGIGFILADRIGSSLGIGKEDDKRVLAGTVHALAQLRQAGHTCYPEADFLAYTAELLDVDRDRAICGLSLAVQERLAFVETVGSGRMVYESGLYAAERELPELLKNICGVKSHAGQVLANMPMQSQIQLNQQQHQAVVRVGQSPLSIITGGPGVGKTTVVGEIIRRTNAARLNVYLTAPTGRAAKRLSESCRKSAKTIHRLLKWEPVTGTFTYNRNHALPCDVLIVDEVSMLDLPLAVNLFRAVKPGTTVVLVGDSDQLPSVGPGRVLNDLITSRQFPVTHLSQIYRQGEGSRIITSAHSVNAGQLPDVRTPANNQLTDFYWIEQEDPEQVVDLISKMVKQRIPKRFGLDPMSDIQVLTPMNRGSCGTQTLNQILQEELNGGHKAQFKSGERIFRIGDRVMQTSNNYDKNVFNGDMGRVRRINTSDKTFELIVDGKPIQYEFAEADQLTLAYAITVHKSQGSEFPAVIVPMLTQHYMMLQRNLLYTAMTRAKKLLVLIGSKKAISMAVRNYTQEPRHTLLLDRLSW